MEHKNKPPEWYSHNVPPEHHHPHNEWLVDRCSDQCDDQLPLFSRVGRGLQGNGYKVEVEQASDCETYLHGYIYDSATGTFISDWQSHNVNGGHLSYQYHLHPYGEPPTFTITFKYDRPCYDDEHDMSWEWTTPAIPYIDEALGAGIGTLFLKKTTDPSWGEIAASDLPTPHDLADAAAAYEKLIYPDEFDRDELNSPLPGADWSVNLEYGIGGDIDAPNIDDLAKIIGVTPAYLRELVEERAVPTNVDFGHDGNDHPYNVKEYIDNSIPSVKEGNGITVTKNGTEYTVSTDLVGSSNIQITYNSQTGTGTISTDALAKANEHLHKDLYGKNVTGHDYTTEITNLELMPLGGDSGTKSVWDWIKHAISTAAADATTKANSVLTHLHKDLGYNDPTVTGEWGGVTLWGDQASGASRTAKDTVWKWFKWMFDQLGFGDSINNFDELSNVNTVKQYINREVGDLQTQITNLNTKLDNVITLLNSNIYGGINQSTSPWRLNVPGKIAVGTLNVFTNVNDDQTKVTIRNADNSGNLSDIDPNYIMTRNPDLGDTRSI